MAKKNTIIAISVVASLAVGYLAGSYFGVPAFPKDEAAGSVNKSRLSNSGKTDPEVLAAMELLQNDAQTQAKVSASALLLASRVSQMNDLAKSTAELSANIESLKSVNEYMTSLSKRTGNAVTAFEDYATEIVKVMNGEKSSSYEQASNNAILAFTMLESNIADCTECVWTLTDYLKSNKNDALAQAACKWMDFCAEDAVLNDSKQEMERWNQIFQDIASDNLGMEILGSSRFLAGIIINPIDPNIAINNVIAEINNLQMPGYEIINGIVKDHGAYLVADKNNIENVLSLEASTFFNALGLNNGGTLNGTIAAFALTRTSLNAIIIPM